MVITAGSPADGGRLFDRAVLRTITQAQDDLDDMGAGLRRRMAELHARQDTFEKAVNKQSKSLKAVSANRTVATAKSTQHEHTDEKPVPIPSATASAESGHRKPPVPPTARKEPHNAPDVSASSASTADLVSAHQFDQDLDHLNKRLKEMQLLMPATGGMFVNMFLGSINVRFVRKSERLAFKREYERLKMKLAPVFVVTCLLCLYFEDYRWLHMCLQLALSCYYISLAVRENILRANGSNIRAWWIIHHYFTMMQGVLLLTWPDGESYARFRRPLHLFGLYNAVLMIFQTRYQMARLYTLRSLGMANEMDVASSDSTQIHWSETMRLLLPLIVLGQIMQGSQALRLFRIYMDFPKEVQILFLSLLSLANFIGNSITTMQVLLAKRHKQRSQVSSRTLPPPDIDPPTSEEAQRRMRQEEKKVS